MNTINYNYNENLLWQQCFPYTTQFMAQTGFYFLRSEAEALTDLQRGIVFANPFSEALVRLELACIALWPQVEDLFLQANFPHILACATDILRAVVFGKETEQQASLVQELVDSLNDLEALLSTQQTQEQQAAEPGPEETP